MRTASMLPSLTRGFHGTWTVSGRAALALVLEEIKQQGVQHVHLPAYLCKSLILPVKESGLNFSFYPVGECMAAEPDPLPGSAVLLIHYFGWLNPATERLRNRAGHDYVLVEDMTHSLLSNWRCLDETMSHVFFSARKWGPIPLGGWCNTVSQLHSTNSSIQSLAQRSAAARRLRGEYLAQADALPVPVTEAEYLGAFRGIEEALDAAPCCGSLPADMYQSLDMLDWSSIAHRRRANWQSVVMQLDGRVQLLMPNIDDGLVPFGLVVQLEDRDRVRAQLASQRIYCPVHWALPTDVDGRKFPFAHQLSQSCLTLPIDQRYGEHDLSLLAGALISAIGR